MRSEKFCEDSDVRLEVVAVTVGEHGHFKGQGAITVAKHLASPFNALWCELKPMPMAFAPLIIGCKQTPSTDSS